MRLARDKYGVVGLPELAVRCSEQIWQTVIAKLEFEGHKGYLRLLVEESWVASPKFHASTLQEFSLNHIE